VKARVILSLVLGLGLAAQAPVLSKAQVLPITGALADDAAVVRILEPLRQSMTDAFGKVLVKAPKGLFKGFNGEENFLGYWVADLMRERAAAILGAPIPFSHTNTGGLRANLRAGEVKVGDVYQVMPFENELVIFEMSGSEIVELVKHGLQRRQGEPSSGVRAVVSGTLDHMDIAITWDDGEEIDPQRRYPVATSDYLAGNWNEIHPGRKGPAPIPTGLTLRQLLLDDCAARGKAKQDLLPPPAGRYTFSPEILSALKDKRKS